MLDLAMNGMGSTHRTPGSTGRETMVISCLALNLMPELSFLAGLKDIKSGLRVILKLKIMDWRSIIHAAQVFGLGGPACNAQHDY